MEDQHNKDRLEHYDPSLSRKAWMTQKRPRCIDDNPSQDVLKRRCLDRCLEMLRSEEFLFEEQEYRDTIAAMGPTAPAYEWKVVGALPTGDEGTVLCLKRHIIGSNGWRNDARPRDDTTVAAAASLGVAMRDLTAAQVNLKSISPNPLPALRVFLGWAQEFVDRNLVPKSCQMVKTAVELFREQEPWTLPGMMWLATQVFYRANLIGSKTESSVRSEISDCLTSAVGHFSNSLLPPTAWDALPPRCDPQDNAQKGWLYCINSSALQSAPFEPSEHLRAVRDKLIEAIQKLHFIIKVSVKHVAYIETGLRRCVRVPPQVELPFVSAKHVDWTIGVVGWKERIHTAFRDELTPYMRTFAHETMTLREGPGRVRWTGRMEEIMDKLNEMYKNCGPSAADAYISTQHLVLVKLAEDVVEGVADYVYPGLPKWIQPHELKAYQKAICRLILKKDIVSVMVSESRRGAMWEKLAIASKDEDIEEQIDVCDEGSEDPGVVGGDKWSLCDRLDTLRSQSRDGGTPVKAGKTSQKKMDGTQEIEMWTHLKSRKSDITKHLVYGEQGPNGEELAVEDLVLQHYMDPENGGWNGVHSEWTFPELLTGLVMHDIVWEEAPACTFFHKYQGGPLDSGRRGLHRRRGPRFDEKLREIRNMSGEQLKVLIGEQWNKLRGLEHTDGLRYMKGRRFGCDQVVNVVGALGGRRVYDIVSLYCTDRWAYCWGFPDLILWRSTGEILVVEVKSASDTVSRFQRFWMQFLEECNINTVVARVREIA